MGEGGVEFFNVLAAALGHVGPATATAIEQRAGFTHQHAHISRSVGGAGEDETRGVAITRGEQRDRLRLRDECVRELVQRFGIATVNDRLIMILGLNRIIEPQITLPEAA